jgi:iron complex transport system permease protein
LTPRSQLASDVADRETAPPSLPRTSKSCQRCGRAFGCGFGEPGCWCEQVTLRRETLREIRALADDCLCPACLESFAARDSAADEAGHRAAAVAGAEGARAPMAVVAEPGALAERAAPADAAAGAAAQGGVLALTSWAKAIPHHEVRARGVRPLWRGSALLFLLLALLVGLGVGPVAISPGAILRSATSNLPLLGVHSNMTPIEEAIVWQIRAPRVVLAALVGAMLAAAGSAYQGVFRNPLADPYLLGVAAGAGLGATIAIVYAGASPDTGELLPLTAFAGGVIAVLAAYVLGASAGEGRGTGVLILAGVTVAAFATAVQTFLLQENTQTLKAVYSWLLGGFAAADWNQVLLVAPYIAISCAVLVAHGRMLDVLSLGDEEAGALGVRVRRVRLLIVVTATAGTAAAVAVSGLIGFVGIIVPHTIRLLMTTSYRAVVALSVPIGAGFLVLADVIARSVLSPQELPIGVVTAFFGAPFFAVVLRTMRRLG